MVKNEKGYAILIVLLSIVFISIIGFSLLTVSSQSIKTSTNEKEDQSLYFVAEAGLNYAIEEIQKEISAKYAALQENPPANFDSEFKKEVIPILESYKDKQSLDTLLKASDNKKPEIWVENINETPTDTDTLITFKIKSEGKDSNSTYLRTVEREIAIPNKLHTVVGNGIPESSYNIDDDNDDKFLQDIDKEQEKEAIEVDEDKLTEPTGPVENATGTSGNLYVSDNTRIYATRYQHFNARIKVSNSSSYNFDHSINNFYQFTPILRIPTAILNNTKQLWKKFDYKETVKHTKKKDNYSKSTTSNTLSFTNGNPNSATLNISNDNVYKVPSLIARKNYVITINLTNKNANPTIVFDKGITNYDLANVIIDVKGEGNVTVKFDENYIVSSNRKLIIRKENPSTKINAIFNKNLAVLGVLEVDGDVTVYRDFKAYFKESIITGDLYLVSHRFGILPFTSDLTIYKDATLNVGNIYTIDNLNSIYDPTIRILGSLNANNVYAEDFTSYPLAKINLHPRKTTLTPGTGYTEGIDDEFISDEELFKPSPMVEIK